jgi:hypothetical protein
VIWEDDWDRWQPLLRETNRSRKPNASHLTGKGTDMTNNLAEDQGHQQNCSPARELQARLKTEFRMS